jgi:homoserine kinase type II
MAVYTPLTDAEIAGFVAEYDIGRVVSCRGIMEGVENTTYHLVTASGPFILSLFETRVKADDLPFFLALMGFLADRDVPCPRPVAGRDAVTVRHLAGRPAAVVTFLPGRWPRRPTVAQCAAIGEALAHLHLAAADFPGSRPNDLALAAWRDLLDACSGLNQGIPAPLANELREELETLASLWPTSLPRGIVHADLFPDNAFFSEDRLTGIIDFYFACTDLLAYDLAICLNAWCFDSDSGFKPTRAAALIDGYDRRRPLAVEERQALPLLARGAALRFLLTRLHDRLQRRNGAIVRSKDPAECLARLRFHRAVCDWRTYVRP